jgi:hypothetical protein
MSLAQQKEALIRAFHSSLWQGESYARINQARKQAEEILGVSIAPGSPLTKVVDEAMEAAIVRVAPSLIAQSTTTHEAYDSLVDLLHRQPVLGVHSSTSVLQQAYSTPIPIAYLASTLAGVTPDTTVYEPTAGNGALLIGANPAQVIANELNRDRFAELKQRGYRQLSQHDASTYRPEVKVDIVLTNPPFGVVHGENGKVKRFAIPGNRRKTRQVDHAIALRALETMKDDGRAVLILGGKLGNDEDLRSDRYNSIESRGFFYALYQHYNVTQHFSIWGDLYRKQGAGFPIDVILIEGRGRSSRDLPAADVPTIYKSFDALKELLPHEPVQNRHLPRIQNLSSGLETPGGERAVPLSGQNSPSRERVVLAGLSVPDDVANSVDAPSVVRDERRGSGTDPPPLNQGTENPLYPGATESLRGLRDEGTRTPLVVDAGMGRDVRGAQRNAGNQIRDQQWIDVSISHFANEQSPTAGVDAGTQRIHPGQLALRFDLRDERVDPNPDAESRTQTMATPQTGHSSPDAPLNVAYVPRSQGRSPGTLIPANMATAAQIALDKLEAAVGDVDEFVQQRMGYNSKEDLWKYLYAEQIDANALAFWQRDKSKVFLNGDQTGNGKGRFCASQIVDAMNQGYIPVFVTQKPTLYVSMLADLQDIGKGGVRIFATDSNLRLTLPDGSKLRTGNPAEQQDDMQRLMQQGMGNYDAVFTTYSQLQTIDNGKEPFRREFLRDLAPRSIFIFDEAHEAGGSTGEQGWVSSSAAPNRAEFARELIDRSAGAVFASATAIKDPAVMDLYARRSDAADAVSDISSLQRTLKDGGVPLQQMIAAKFVASGQMLRRERSFEGVSFQAKVVGVDRQVADDISSIMRAISQFDLAKEKAVAKLSKQLKKEAKAASEDNSIGQTGARSTNFTSLMNNAIDQGLLCQKAEATVQEAIRAITRGQKPVIAVANTMDAFIGQYAEDNNLQPGDVISISFGDVLSRYLERSRDVTIKDHEGNATRRRMTDDELGDDALAAYDNAREIIDNTDLSGIPLSSIDYIKWRLTSEGFRVDEITGRHNIIDYTETGEQGYARRSTSETRPQARVEIVDRFNAGDLDVLILNRAGATGINLHASEKFADQKQRHLIMAQAERDINQVMQMLGRVNRFGQVSEPEITLLMSDIPAEKRLGALLSHKMATLNANTTADRDSALSVSNVVDFLTPYGEEVINEILDDLPELEAKLAFPREKLQGESDIEVISRTTGRIPLLSIQEQEELYALIESETLDLVAQKQAMGESVLAAQQLDLDARTIGRMEVIADEGSIRNEFTGPVYLDVIDAKIPIKPLTQLEVINLVRENLKLEPVRHIDAHDFEQTEALAKEQVEQKAKSLRQETNKYRATILSAKFDNYGKVKATERIHQQFAHVSGILRDYPPGQPVRVVSPEGNITYGVVGKIWQKGHHGNPTAPTNWRAQILTDNQARMVTIPLTRFNRGKEGMMTTVTRQETNWEGQDIYEAFDLKQRSERTERQIFGGNLLKAYEKYPEGKFVNFTDHQGNVQQGLIMPASFDIQESLREQPVVFNEPRQVKAFLTDLTQYQGSVKTPDEVLTIKSQTVARFGSQEATGFVLQTPKSAIGDRFSLDKKIIAAAGSDFYSVSDRMELVVSAAQIDEVLHVLMKEQNVALAAFDFKDKTREFLGVKLPQLQPIIDEPAAQPHQHPPVPLILTQPVEDDFSKQPQPFPTLKDGIKQIAPSTEQQGRAEKNVAKFLQQADLAQAVLEGEDFHLRIENEPYIPLVIERHGKELFLTHYLEEYGDIFIDSEMAFRISEDSKLRLQETAVPDPFRGGEYRACDREFAQLFSKNILQQGFAQAARETSLSTPWNEHASAALPANELNVLATQTNEEKMSEPSTTNTPQVADNNHEDVEQQISLFSAFQYESVTPAANAISTFDPSWQELEIQSHDQNRSQRETQSGHSTQKIHQVENGETHIKEHIIHSAEKELGADWRQLADQVRNLSLQDLAHQFGLELDRSDKSKWRMSGFCISINGNKFFDHYADKGGVGAIDFTMHVKGYSFQEAVESLAHERPVVTPSPQQREEKYPRCNVQDESKWQAARSYLIEERRLPTHWVDALHQQRLISVDSRRNIMFFRHQMSDIFERGDAIGANLRGTLPNRETGEFFKGLTTGTTREEGYFWFEQGEGQVKQVVITESPIDAISYATLDSSSNKSIYISSDGQGVLPIEALQQVLNQGGEIVLAYDHDRQGERMAWQVAQQFPDIVLKREVPATGKDWNDELLGKESPLDPRRETGDKLWKWYETASKSDRATISQIGIEFNAANKPRDLTSAELSLMDAAITQIEHDANLTIATEILQIAERAYAFSESIDRLQFYGECWTVRGNSYTLHYDSTNDIFEVEGRNGMFVQRLAGQINLDTMSLSSLDLEVFQETERFLNRKEFSTTQTPSQTVAIAQEKQDKSQPSQVPASNQPEPQQPTLQELRSWYKQARDLGRSDSHLNQIEQVGKAFVQGEPLSQKSLHVLSNDKADWEKMVQQIAQNAQTILSIAGQPHADGSLFKGKQYSLYSQDEYLYVLASKRGKQPTERDGQCLPVDALASNPGIILKLEQDNVVPPTRVTSADHQRFEQFAHQIAQKNLQPSTPHEYDR